MFKFDPNYLENEEKYHQIKAEILGENESNDGSGSEGSDSEESGDEDKEGTFMGLLTVSDTDNYFCSGRE